jgi:HPt (histidine-containing phosphotransfer) domain-containing protein
MSNPAASALPRYYPDASVEVVDQEQLELLTMAAEEAGPEFWEDIIGTFESEIGPRFGLIEQACASGDATNLRKSIHFIAGSAANLGLSRLSALCRNIENAIDAGRFEDYEACAEAVRWEYDNALEAVRKSLAAV